ncbi:MAG: helix-turn-helix domain-containing protein, partial [Acidimicrobiia bacterium]|nr:helix-turn-helix domain-containing protein [Acidimicrobiia bacterium]
MGCRGKLEEQAKARDLRAAGLTMDEIAEKLGVSKSSVSLWVRDVPFEPRPIKSKARRRGPNSLQKRKQE